MIFELVSLHCLPQALMGEEAGASWNFIKTRQDSKAYSVSGHFLFPSQYLEIPVPHM